MTTQESLFEQLIQGVINDGYGVVDHFISDEMEQGLKNNLKGFLVSGAMKQAGMGQHSGFQNNQAWRGDQIKWLEAGEGESVENDFLSLLGQFLTYLNLTCYAGLNEIECHYASYDTGSFYKKHLDQFATNADRKYSMIMYLNDDWKESEGGQLLLHRDQDQVAIVPEGGKMVFFESNSMWHEVLPATRPRMSLAGWMKQK